MKEKEILIILPTKNRIDDFKIFADSWINTTEGHSDVLVAIDYNDQTYDSVKDKYPFLYEDVIPPKTFMQIANPIALKYCNDYKYISVAEDDFSFLTKGWESRFLEKLETLGDNAIVYANDNLHKYGELVPMPFMSAKIIQKLGYMTPLELKCMFADNFWKDLGDRLGSLHYFDDIIIEHRHYSAGKREKDDISIYIDTLFSEDRNTYLKYKSERFENDILKLKQL